jgi:hypothetical protein
MSENFDPIMPEAVEQAKRLMTELPKWLGSLPPEELQRRMYDRALDAVDEAILETRRYIRRRVEGESRDGVTEGRLSDLWLGACTEICLSACAS